MRVFFVLADKCGMEMVPYPKLFVGAYAFVAKQELAFRIFA